MTFKFGGKLAWPLVLGTVVALCALGLYRGRSHLGQVREELAQVRATNQHLDKENRAMYRQVDRLRSDPQYLERTVRHDMGVLRSDEVVYQAEQPLARPLPKEQP